MRGQSAYEIYECPSGSPKMGCIGEKCSELKEFYYRGLNEWEKEPGYLIDTCLTAQDQFKKYLDYFGLEYHD